MPTKVVHLKREPYDIRIDRESLFGNPWTHKEGTRAQFVVGSRTEAIACYRDWLLGIRFHNVLQIKRRQIIDLLPSLQGKTLGCWCKPKACHGEVLVELLEMKQPAVQVISVARKPLSESSVAANIHKWGTGGININDTRVGYQSEADKTPIVVGRGQGRENPGCGATLPGHKANWEAWEVNPVGRWPANVILTHKPSCKLIGTKQVGKGEKIIGGPPRSASAHIQQMSKQPRTEAVMSYGTETVADWDCVADCVIGDLGEQSGVRQSTRGTTRGGTSPNPMSWGQGRTDNDRISGYDDQGTAARFYKQFQRTDIMSMAPPQELIGYLHTMITPPDGETLVALDLSAIQWEQYLENQVHGMIIMGDPTDYLDQIWRILRPGGFLMAFAPPDHPVGYRTTCAIEDRGFEIRDAICLVREPGALHYFPKAASCERNAGLEGDRNQHPTVKPVALMKKLLNKVATDQVVLDPFSGSGTTGVAAVQTGHSVILIDREKEYCEIATTRINHWDREKAGWLGVEIQTDTPLEQEQVSMSLDDLFGFGEEK